MGRQIRELRGHRTLEEFARLVGVTAPAILRYEAGRIPRSDILVRIAKVGRKTVEWLLHGEKGRLPESVSEPPTLYHRLDRSHQKLLKDVEALIQEGDAEITAHLRQQVALLRKLKKSQAKKV